MPPPPHHPQPHPNGTPGIESLPVEFERLNMGRGMPLHASGNHNMHRPIPDNHPNHLENIGHGFDTSLLRKEKEQYEGYNFEKVKPQNPKEKATWAVVTKTKMPLNQSELLAQVNKQKRKRGLSAGEMLYSSEMKGYKRKQVDQLVDDRSRMDPRFQFSVVALKLDQARKGPNEIQTVSFQVILKRELRSDLSHKGATILSNTHGSNTETVDLTEMFDEFSEGSSQNFPFRGSPPAHTFRPIPSPPHGFQDPPSFDHHQGPFGQPLGPTFHNPHQGSPPPRPFPRHDDGPLIHHDGPHQGHHPGHPEEHIHPAFMPPMPQHEPFHSGPAKKPKEEKEHYEAGKGQKIFGKEPKDFKPKVHQDHKHDVDKKHKKSLSDSDSDSASEHSEFSRADTDRTPDTDYSSNSSHKGKKYHGSKDRSRNSHSHFEAHEDDRHEGVYRVHRRKPAWSPSPQVRGGRSRYGDEDVLMMPASDSHRHRPGLARSRTSAYRHERMAEHFDRPKAHSRHLIYDDEHYFDGPEMAPPVRRGSVYVPKRSTDLDLYDAREQQDRLLREEVRREVMMEERRREDMRESMLRARQYEREADQMRRRDGPARRERFYDEPPRRYSPGRYPREYDNDRYVY